MNDNHCDACLKLSNRLDALTDEKQKLVAMLIKNNICPFGVQPPGKALATCPSGFPGCGCADELMLNPYLDIGQEDSPTDCPCGQPILYETFHRGPIEPDGIEHHCTCGRIWVGTSDPKVLTMKWGSKRKAGMCSECGVNPEPSYGGWCPDCACGAESGCPAKYGHEDEPCPHDWCPHGGRSPR